MQTDFHASRRRDCSYTAYDLTRDGRKFGALVQNRLGSWTYHDDSDAEREHRVRQAQLLIGAQAYITEQLVAVRSAVGPSALARAEAAVAASAREHSAAIVAQREASPLARAMATLERRLRR